MTATRDDELAELRRANAELRQRLDAALAERDEALDQQAATSDVMKVISRSTSDLQPVLQTVLDTAMRLCGNPEGEIFLLKNDVYRMAVSHGLEPAYREIEARQEIRAGLDTVVGRAALAGRPIHIVDVLADPAYAPKDDARVGKFRTALGVPLLHEGVAIGVICTARRIVAPFTEKQIELISTFAVQAVIAMENARLLTETRRALEWQTATSDILRTIAAGDADGTLRKIAETTLLLFGAAGASFRIAEGDEFKLSVSVGAGAEQVGAALWDDAAKRPTVGGRNLPGTVVRENRQIHLADLDHLDPDIADWPGPPVARSAGMRTMIGTPLRTKSGAIGALTVYRDVLRPFEPAERDLLQSFADQAVIAIENARLITETHEALEQQTATAEVLGVINGSPGNLAPVFDAMLEKALHLCNAVLGTLFTYDGELMHPVAMRGASPEYEKFLRRGPQRPGAGALGDFVGGKNLHHIPDLKETDTYRQGDEHRRALVDLGGARALVGVPLRKDARLLGGLLIYRREPTPFTEKQIALLQNFAAQAVIAMENARLITETREALEQQTATAEVLGVINSSPGNLAPVFDAILEKAHTLCGAVHGHLTIYDGEHFRAVATHGVPEQFARLLRQPFRPGADLAEKLLGGEGMFHVPDMATLTLAREDRIGRAAVELGGARTLLAVPLRKDDALLGYITAHRQEVRPFTDKEISLLQNFAAQAVIAMENARLLDEIRQRQAELRVTFDNMADGVVMFDEGLRLAAWNRNFQELLDLPDAVLAERPSYADYLRILAERGEFGTDDIEAELSRRLEQTHQELRLERTRPDGRVIEVRRNAVPDGGFVLIYSDITERKRSEAEIRAARDTAEATLRDLRAAQASLVQAEKMASLGQLTAGIAHEIKNPLNFVNNFAALSVELLDELKETTAPAVAAFDDDKRGEIDETIVMLAGNLEKIAEHGKRADNIVKSMLEHSRGVSGERREVDLNGVIEEALNLAYHGARAQNQDFNITLERDYEEGLTPIEVAPQEITRVFLNLFGNGFYAANKRSQENGEGLLRPILVVATRDLGDAVEVRVRDNGIGIPPEIRDKLFQPFFTTKPAGEGTGLGLSISYDIITQQHGGTITVDSRVGEFTEFAVRLPRTHRASAEAAS